MPGTIQVSILELVGLPSLQQSSSMGIKVSMGKQAFDMQEKGDFFFVLASLRDNLSVSIHDSEGNQIADTGVETRLIVEKGMWDDSFPLQGGGHVRMRLHFILTEEEQKRIRSMRESATRKKHEDLLQRSHSSSDLAVASGDSLKIHQTQEGNVNPAGRNSNKISTGLSAEVHNEVHPGQNKQAFSTSKSTGALDKLTGFQLVKKGTQHQDVEPPSQLKKTPSSVRNMILAFESSPVKEPSSGTSKTRATSRLSSTTMIDIPLKAPKTMVAVRAEQELPSLETVSAVIAEEIISEGETVRDHVEAFQETLPNTRSTDILLKLPEKMVAVSTKQLLPNLKTVPASMFEEIVSEREDSGDYVDDCRDTLLSTSTTDIPWNLHKKMVSGSPKPVLTNLDTVPAAPKFEEIVAGREEVGDNIDASQETSCSTTMTDVPLKAPKKTVAVTPIPVFSKLESVPARISENLVTDKEEVGGYVDPSQEMLVQKTEQLKELAVQPNDQMSKEMDISEMLPAKEVGKEDIIPTKKLHTRLAAFGESKVLWKILSGKSFMRRQIPASFDSIVFKKTRRSKHPKPSEHKLKSKMAWGKEYYSSGTFRGWIFLEDMIHSCVRSDDRRLVDLLEGGYSNCCRDTIQEKQRDTDAVPSTDTETRSVERPHSRPNIRPVRQALNIAVMVGFGILVFLTRQRK